MCCIAPVCKSVSVVFSPADSPVLSSRVAVTVHVLDINEFPPELASPYETFVCENSKAGQVLSHVFCTHYAFVVEHRKLSSVKTVLVCPPIKLTWLQGGC